MIGKQQDSIEPSTVLIQAVHVRRGDTAAPLADLLVALLDAGEMLIDLSHLDRRSDTIEVRASQRLRSDA